MVVTRAVLWVVDWAAMTVACWVAQWDSWAGLSVACSVAQRGACSADSTAAKLAVESVVLLVADLVGLWGL